MASPEERIIPLFPLRVVLFPFSILPLQIFEERYKQMLRDCLEADSRFGVALIKEGEEVGEPAMPHTVGAIARIRRVVPLEGGRFSVLAMGERRFQVLEIVQWRPYEKARVRVLEEAAGDPPPTEQEIEGIRERVAPFLRSILGLRGGWTRHVDSPAGPIDLSFFVASVIRADPQVRQRILEAPSARERLAMLVPILEEDLSSNLETMKERLLLNGARLN
ncbi:MAG: LON peptidase substrate-binding domain-containing protein [Chloroflexi bacterium]|nr:LON peptidase substrate-binding domain-containing protein [Chloroflexota bacterium]